MVFNACGAKENVVKQAAIKPNINSKDSIIVTPQLLNTSVIHTSWQPLLSSALTKLDPAYLTSLNDSTWLPGPEAIFNAFSLPLPKTQYILFGESPYPRALSANGYAFWDAQVLELWSETGFDSRVNRATSLRNFLKMLLVAEGKLSPDDVSQNAIAALNKNSLVQTCSSLFSNFIKKGFLLLNASLVLSSHNITDDAKAWRPFMERLLENLTLENKKIKLLLFGRIANEILKFPVSAHFTIITAEHPYNLSFIKNEKIINLFKDLHLLGRVPKGFLDAKKEGIEANFSKI
ncbi:MAG: Uracil DNA glycosylase [uncultured bacterium]|nr:MAG: Uracil DNA glycosylase [uncultured bacterium]